MKAAVYLGPKQMEVRQLPDPECGPDEVVLKIEVCAVCGTDARIYNYGQANVVPPQVIGHEISGSIAEVGSNLEGYEVGQRVTAATPVGCGKCRLCKKQRYNLCVDFRALGYHFPGAFAQYMKVPAEAVKQGNIIPLPDNVTFEQAALVEPLSCVVNGQEFLQIQAGDTVVIFGAGPIGCMHAELARARGAGKVIIVEVSADRLSVAERVHADLYLNPQEEDPVARVMKETDDFGAEVAICACSAPIVNKQALALASRRGRISYFAGLPKTSPTIEFDCNRLHYNEISLFGAFASNNRQYREALELVATGKFDADKFITSRFPLEGLEEALINSQKATGLKMISLPQA